MFAPFDRTRSHLLDAVIFLIDHRPPLLVRFVLRRWKAVLESGGMR
jgi:hypothetical protein